MARQVTPMNSLRIERLPLALLLGGSLLGCTVGGTLPTPAPYSGAPEQRHAELRADEAPALAAGRGVRHIVVPTPDGAILWPLPPGQGQAAATLEVRENTYPDGTLRTQWQVRVSADGTAVRHGRLLRYHPNGQIAVRGAYRDGRPSGVWTWFDERGHALRSAVPQGDYDEVLSGRDLENPNSVYYDLKGRKLAEGLRKYDKPHGLWSYYHPDGSVAAQGRYVDGLPDGRWVFYFRTGQVERQEDYKLGVPDGEVLRGWPNGQEQLEGRVEQGLRVGRWRTWFKNGQVESDGHYQEDRREGEWRFWDAQGKLVAHQRYAAGRLAEELPLPAPRVGPPPVLPDARLLPFRPRIYDESGAEIKLSEVPPQAPATATTGERR
jgi:antitoxin component YwqK of YwqJK toxin-antitoxin module